MGVVIRWMRAWWPGLGAVWCVALVSAVQAQSPQAPQRSIGESISSGVSRIGDALTPRTPVTPADDPVSLQSKGKPGIELYVAVARLYEETGKFAEAEAQYKRAIQESPNDLRVLLGYARLKDRMGDPQEAEKFYQRAARAYPQDPSVFNNLAVHYARQGMLRDAVTQLEQAVRLRPKEMRYRNNMATLLVEMGRPQDAFTHLRAVHDEASAHYNLGFLFNRKGQGEAASREFATALRLNPTLAQARQMLERADQTAMQGQRPAQRDARMPAQEAQTAVRAAVPAAAPTARFGPTVAAENPAARSSVASREIPAVTSGRAENPRQVPPGVVVEYPPMAGDRGDNALPRVVQGSPPRVAAQPPYRYSAAPPEVNRAPMSNADPRQAPANTVGVRTLPPPPVRLPPPDEAPAEAPLPGNRSENGTGPQLLAPMPPGN